MTKKTTFSLIFSILLFVAVLAGTFATCVDFSLNNAPVIPEVEFFDSTFDPSSTPIAIEVQAFVRSDSPLAVDDIDWVFDLSHSLECEDFKCSLVPAGVIENLECNNPDGSTHFVAIINAVMYVQKPVKTLRSTYSQAAISSSSVSSSHKKHREILSDHPAIILSADLATRKLNLKWSTVNIPDGDCKLMFKIIKDRELPSEKEIC